MAPVIVIGSVLFAFIGLSYQISTPASTYYTAGVVEYEPKASAIGSENENIQEYVNLIKSIKDMDIDILVFPEKTFALYGSPSYVPEPEDGIIPCEDNRYPIIAPISCAAIESNTYVVVNIDEISDCTEESQAKLNDTRPCATNGLNLYNANIVFDRKGAVISRYRKFNLFGEFGTNTTLVPDVSIFSTDYGVKFGHFICFDLMFDHPALDLIKLGVQNIAFPTMWFSEAPFLTAVQAQQNWAYINNVNFLGAGASQPSVGSTGSGIYSGRLGGLVSVMTDVAESKIYTAKVPKIPGNRIFESTCDCHEVESVNENDLPDLSMLRDVLEVYDSIVIDARTQTISENICNKGFCCDFNIEMSSKSLLPTEKSYQYRMATFNGIRTFGGYASGGVAVCAIIACVNGTIEGCGLPYINTTNLVEQITFESILIRGKFEGGAKNLYMPNGLKRNMLPLEPIEFNFIQGRDYEENGSIYRDIYYQLETPQSRLISFGIYSRIFERDGGDPDQENNGGDPDQGNNSAVFLNSRNILEISVFILISVLI